MLWLLAPQAHLASSLSLELRPIVLGDNSLNDSIGEVRIDLDHGNFNNVLYVLGIASSLLSVYQMTHNGSPKKAIFFPNEFEITNVSNGKFIAKGVVDHTSKVYKFSHFIPYLNPSALLTHANEERKIWHEMAILATSIFLI